MDVAHLVAEARARAGSSDLGADTWQEGLEVLVRSLDEDAALNELGAATIAGQLVDHLVNRLHVERWHAAHPEIAEEEVVAPLFGLGMPRTGSTALSYLLAQDPARRSLRVWEAAEPCPPPETATEGTDERIARAQAGVDLTNAMFPGFAGMLPTAADGPQECLVPMASDFRSLVFEGMAHVPGYSEWLLGCDMAPAYRYHRRVLQLLQWRCPPTRWWLKSPAHMLSIEALDAEYPDARFVMTHRDVGQVLPSVCALYATFIGVLSDESDPVAIGAHNQAVWRTALDRLLAFRARGNDGRFVDLDFAAVQRDPLTEVARLYEALGDELTDEARNRMAAWWDAQARDRSGPARHEDQGFALDPAAIAADFADYHERFGLARPTEA